MSLDAPLTEVEIRTFLEIVRELPGGRLPEFEPLAQSSVDDRLPAATLVNVYREEYRRMLDPVEQGHRWRSNRALNAVLDEHCLRPEDFAGLLTRLGCAVAAGAVSSRFNLTEASERADQQLLDLIGRIDEWDRRAAAREEHPVRAIQLRQPLVDQLKDLVALAEFSRVLLNVPEESLAAVAQHKRDLAAHLPASGNIHMFERTLDAEAIVVPVSLERPE